MGKIGTILLNEKQVSVNTNESKDLQLKRRASTLFSETKSTNQSAAGSKIHDQRGSNNTSPLHSNGMQTLNATGDIRNIETGEFNMDRNFGGALGHTFGDNAHIKINDHVRNRTINFSKPSALRMGSIKDSFQRLNGTA